jgi:hypothetical protein
MSSFPVYSKGLDLNSIARIFRAGALASMRAAKACPMLEKGETSCCYSKSKTSLVSDPDGVLWKAVFTSGDAPELALASAGKGACCTAEHCRAHGGLPSPAVNSYRRS